ncbi:GNAT family N-acetyltransferase [Campylobacter jejuni]|nr:GNAT family N-acetyltransferase [Campylobacter jejuni]
MIKIIAYTSNLKEEWNNFNKHSKNGLFMFDRNYMDYHSDRFKDNSLMFYEDNKLIALLPCNIKDNILYSHQGLTFGGFISDDNMKQNKMLECFVLLKEYMKINKIGKLIYKSIPYIYHKKPSDEDLYALFRNDAKLFRVDCSTTIDLQNICKMPKGRKAQISRAKREGVEIIESEDFDNFVVFLNSVLQKHHGVNAVHNADELKLLHSRFFENIKLFVARLDSEIIAASLVFIYENLVHAQYLASSDKGREIGALDLLIKSLMDKFSLEKRYFDFGISTEDNGKFLNQGLISQKEGFGGRAIVHMTYDLFMT